MKALQLLQNELKASPPWIVGILNVTPDSFSDGGKFVDPQQALAQAEELHAGGAHIIEIGGEATGPGSKPLSAIEELKRIEEIVTTIASRFFVSVDTYHGVTMKAVLGHGVRMINDISALRADPESAKIIAESACWVVLMHAKDAPLPHVTENTRDYADLVTEIKDFFSRQVLIAKQSGIAEEKIIIDPGMGRFLSHDANYSWELLRRLSEFNDNTCPLMIGTSRKGFLGGTPAERDPASQFTAYLAVTRGAHFIRTHNPKMMREFLEIGRKI